MKLFVATPERKLIESDNVTRMIVPASNGEITILPSHTPLMSSLGMGGLEVFYGSRAEPDIIFVSDGFIQVNEDEVRVFAGLAEHSSELKSAELEESVRKSKERAKENLARMELADVEAKLARDLAKLKLISQLSRRPKNLV